MFWFSIWEVIKASGFTASFLLLTSISFGAFSYGKTFSPPVRANLLAIHQMSGWLGFLFGLLHGMVLTIDPYAPFPFQAVFIPFTAAYRPIASGLGTIALYLLLIVLITSDWMKRFGRKIWRNTHYVAYPAYILSLIHGLLAGSDSKQAWALGFYYASAVVLICVFMARFYVGWKASRQHSL